MFQEKTATLGKANDIIKGVIQSLKEARSNEGFKEIWNNIQSFAEKYSLSFEISYEKESKYFILFLKFYSSKSFQHNYNT